MAEGLRWADVLDMNVPQFRATLRALRRRESERQLRMMHAVFHAAAPCVTGKMDGFDSEAARLFSEAGGQASVAPKPTRKSAFQAILEAASRQPSATSVPA